MRFSLLSLLVAVVVAAIHLGALNLYGIGGLLLCAGVFIALYLGIFVRRRSVRILLFVVAAACCWMVSVHYTVKSYRCATCRYGFSQYRIEFLRVPVQFHEDRFNTLITYIASDLGCPCNHPRLEEVEPWEDYWGLAMCFRPFKGTSVLISTDEDWYREAIQPIVLTLRLEQPDLAAKFCRKVLKQGDLEYWVEFSDEVLHSPSR
jgi:hypothetical protein